MSKMFTVLMSAVVLLGLLGAGGVPPASVAANAQPSTSQSESTDFTGEELFRGVYFLQGPVGEHLVNAGVAGQFSSEQRGAILQTANDPKSLAAVDLVLKELVANDAQFLQNFAYQLSNPRPAAVQHFLAETIELVAATEIVTEVRAERVDATYVPGSDASPNWVVVVVAAGVAIAVGAVAVVTLVMAANAALGFNAAAVKNWVAPSSVGGAAGSDAEVVTAALVAALADA